MALFRDDAGKTEKPTPQRLGDAREKGQVAISRELTMAGALLVAVLVLENFGHWLIAGFQAALTLGMSLPYRPLADGEPYAMMAFVGRVFGLVGGPFTFLVGMFFAATLLFGYSQIGVRVSKKALGIKFERLNPVTNAKRVFSAASLVRTALSLLKLCILSSVLYFVLHAKWSVFARMHDIEDLRISLVLIAEMAFTVFFWIAFVVLIMSLIDVAWQRYDHIQKLMMSKTEVDDERKRSEGDPFIRAKMKATRFEFIKQRLMEVVPTADVVITNPTHYSVAIRYERGRHGAPEVVAKGVNEIALRIREIALEHDIPLMEDPPLARGLFGAVKVGQQIPEKFYRAVAAVLSHIYRLQGQVA